MTKEFENFFNNQWVPIFSAGVQTSSSGYTKEWTKSDLETIVKKYNEQKDHEAPAVIGHPKDNAPAFGWVEQLKTDGKLLYAKFKQLVPEFVDAVKQGMYKKRSISLYGDLMLRHVGFLGAVPPAVKGLADIKFNEDENVLDIEFEEEQKGDEIMTAELKQQIENLQKQLKDNETSFNEKSEASKKEYDALKKQLDEKEVALKDSETKFNEAQKKIETLEKKEEKPKMTEFEEAQQKEINELKVELNRQKQANRVADFKAFVDGLHNEGKIVTDLKAIIVDLLEAAHNAGKANFNENGSVVEAEIVDKFKEYLSKQPKLVSFNEMDLSKQKKNQESSNDEKLHKLAMEYLEKNKESSYAEALTEVQRQNPELVIEL